MSSQLLSALVNFEIAPIDGIPHGLGDNLYMPFLDLTLYGVQDDLLHIEPREFGDRLYFASPFLNKSVPGWAPIREGSMNVFL